MAVRIVYSETARRSLREITLFIAGRDAVAALRLVDEIAGRLETVLGLFPEAVVRLDDEIRFLIVRRYSVVYRFEAAKGEVVVLDVFGPGMDWR